MGRRNQIWSAARKRPIRPSHSKDNWEQQKAITRAFILSDPHEKSNWKRLQDTNQQTKRKKNVSVPYAEKTKQKKNGKKIRNKKTRLNISLN